MTPRKSDASRPAVSLGLENTFEAIAAEVFRKLKIDVTPGELTRDYNANKTTQLPMLSVASTGGRRITRKIQVGSRSVTYERKKSESSKEEATLKVMHRSTDEQPTERIAPMPRGTRG